jgi:hypothetical protein
MNRDYGKLHFYTEERRNHYEEVNKSSQKQIGDNGESIAKQWFIDNGYEVRDSSASQDAHKHIDFYIKENGVWKSVDVKYKKNFYIELTNNWGKPGWIYTGADYIFQMFQQGGKWKWNIDEAYLYKREDMIKYMRNNFPLFIDKFCTKFGKSKLWEVFPIRIKDMTFLKKVKI